MIIEKGELKMKYQEFTICLIVAMVVALLPVCSSTVNAQEESKVSPIKGFPSATLTIFPVSVSITGPKDKNDQYRVFSERLEQDFRKRAGELTDTLGLLLEEKGYDRFEVANTYFQFPTEKSDPNKISRAAAFGQFVMGRGLKTDYALGVQLTVHLENSWQEVYLVIVDSGGNIVWEDSQKPGDPAFDEYSGSDVGRLELACGRLVPAMGLDKLPKKELAENKKQLLRGIRAKEPPNHSERTAMEKQLMTMKQAGSTARVLIYPARVGGDHADPNCAAHLCTLLNEAKLCRASVAKTSPVMDGAGWPNEMQVLWLFARNVREYVAQHPADSDYVLFADYWFAPDGRVWAVHTVLCDRSGDWVMVDLQNSHQEAFQRVNPKDLEDCDRLVLERFEAELR
jgi:hypothetical protein